MRTEETELLGDQFQAAFLKSGMTAEQFTDYVAKTRSNVMSSNTEDGQCSLHVAVKEDVYTYYT